MIEGKFKVRARLLEQLGEQLIKNESIALMELIKNSYDADASSVNILMEKIDAPDEGVIIIEDNGCGMDAEIIQNVWLEPGTDFKRLKVETNERTPVYKRLPLGEKGIGRFAVHKLGKKIEIISKRKEKDEVSISIDWEYLDKCKYLDEFFIEITERKAKYFTNGNTGTKIIISRLKKKWERKTIRELYRAIVSFRNPFDAPTDFNINFNFDKKEWISDLFTHEMLNDCALFKVEALLEGRFITKFRYEFKPYPAMDKIQKRIVDEQDEKLKKLLRIVASDNKEIDLDDYKIGPVNFKAYIFDRENPILRLGISDVKGLKEYIDMNGGIRIYRDGIRVYDYGEPENDWLDLDIRRVNIPSQKLSNNLLVASINLSRDKSVDLIEKTNREGFIGNEAYSSFKSAILYLLNLIEAQRNIDKKEIRKFYGAKQQSQPLVSTIIELKNIIGEKIKDDTQKKELLRYLERIENEYEKINEILLKSAGAGLNLSVAIHEMEKILSELRKIIELEKVNERVVKLVKHLSNLVEGYAGLIKSAGKKEEDIIKIIDQAIFNMEYRIKCHNISLYDVYKHYEGNKYLKVTRSLTLNSLMNIIDNSIWWLDYSKRDTTTDKKIYINLIDKPDGYLSMVIADNGCGFALPEEEIVKPFVSGKPDGMGLGLHIVSEVMKAHGGLLLFPNENEINSYNIPHEYRNGAKTILSFKRS